MKSKKFDKKLLLSKKTVAHLDNAEMQVVQGGVNTFVLCETWFGGPCPATNFLTCAPC
ncbi:MAG: class I lanthipeptide [Candidatus Aminicenantes bacterium]|jgi:hypothetical protein